MKIIFDERSTKFHTDDHNNVVEACNDLLDCKNFYELRGWLYLREVYFALGLNKESLYINPLLGWDKTQTKDFEFNVTENPTTKRIEITVNAVALK